MMKKILALVLSIILFFNYSVSIYANDNIKLNKNISVSSFVDGEGKVNTVYVSVPKKGISHVDYFIEGVLFNTVDVVAENKDLIFNNSIRNDTLKVTYNNKISNISEIYRVPVADYIEKVPGMDSKTFAHNSRYSYLGRIAYNTYYDSFGSYKNDDILAIYSKKGAEDFDYKTLRAEKGSFVSVVIGVVAAILGTIVPGFKAVIADHLVVAAVYAAGSSIVAGIIQGAISQTYYVKTTKYTVKARDNKTNREQFRDAEIFKVALKGGGYSSKDYYEGYLPWNDDIVAYEWFLEFWNYPYPGVRGYY